MINLMHLKSAICEESKNIKNAYHYLCYHQNVPNLLKKLEFFCKIMFQQYNTHIILNRKE